MDDEFLRLIRVQRQRLRSLRRIRWNHASIARMYELASGIDTTDIQRADFELVAPREAGRA